MSKSQKTDSKHILEELKSELRAHFDECPESKLPNSFDVSLDRNQFRWLASNFVDAVTKMPLGPETKFFALNIGNHIVGFYVEEKISVH